MLLITGQRHNLQTHFLQGGAVAGHMTYQGYTASSHGQTTQPLYGYQTIAPDPLRGGESVRARDQTLHTCMECHVTYT